MGVGACPHALDLFVHVADLVVLGLELLVARSDLALENFYLVYFFGQVLLEVLECCRRNVAQLGLRLLERGVHAFVVLLCLLELRVFQVQLLDFVREVLFELLYLLRPYFRLEALFVCEVFHLVALFCELLDLLPLRHDLRLHFRDLLLHRQLRLFALLHLLLHLLLVALQLMHPLLEIFVLRFELLELALLYLQLLLEPGGLGGVRLVVLLLLLDDLGFALLHLC